MNLNLKCIPFEILDQLKRETTIVRYTPDPVDWTVIYANRIACTSHGCEDMATFIAKHKWSNVSRVFRDNIIEALCSIEADQMAQVKRVVNGVAWITLFDHVICEEGEPYLIISSMPDPDTDRLQRAREQLFSLYNELGEEEEGRNTSPVRGLTPREEESARLIASGLTEGEVAASLGVETATVHTHVKGIRRKLGIKGSTRKFLIDALGAV